MPCCDEVNGTGSTGPDSIASPVSTSRHAGFCIPIRRSASSRHDPRQEPYAVTLHVRICAGGGQQWPSLPRPLDEDSALTKVPIHPLPTPTSLRKAFLLTGPIYLADTLH